MNGMRIDKSRWGLGGGGWGGVPARQNPHWGKTIGAGRKNWRLKGGRTFVSDACHKSGPYLPFGKPWTSLWGAISFGQHFQATTALLPRTANSDQKALFASSWILNVHILNSNFTKFRSEIYMENDFFVAIFGNFGNFYHFHAFFVVAIFGYVVVRGEEYW